MSYVRRPGGRPPGGRSRFFSQEEIKILQRIVEKGKWLGQRVTRAFIANKFQEKTGRTIQNLQRISDYRKAIGISYRRENVRPKKKNSVAVIATCEGFLRKEKRVPRKRKWFVDETKLNDNDSGGYSYGIVGESNVVDGGNSTGSGTAICSANWQVGMGPFQYLRHNGSGTTRADFIYYLKNYLLPVANEGDVVYIDQARIHVDKDYRTIEAAVAPKLRVRYLPKNATHLVSPLDRQPFAQLKRLWRQHKHSSERGARQVLTKIIGEISLQCVRAGIKEAGF